MSFWGKLPPWATLALIGVSGLILIIVSSVFEWEWDYGIANEIGIALLAASVLGFTIDRWMKAELRTDAFKAALGQVLQPEFRAEVSRIIGYRLLCERHKLIIDLEIVTQDVVKTTSSVERVIRNKSSYPEKLKNYVHIDEFGFQEKSDILECSITLANGKPISFDEKKRDDFSVRADTGEVSIGPGVTAELRSKWIEYRRINDVNYYHFATPTVDPEIEVRCPDDLECSFGFGTPDQNIQLYHYAPHRKQLKGTYFPHQNMSARWWPKKKVGSSTR